MCFGSRKKSKIIPAGQLSIEKLNTFFTETHINPKARSRIMA
jgi:hypothetical protein